MRAGSLRHVVDLERQSITQDAMGQRVDTWVAFATVRASIEPLKGDEYQASSGEQAELSHKIRIRYSSDTSGLRARDRINYKSQIFEITAPPINLYQANRELQVMCRLSQDD